MRGSHPNGFWDSNETKRKFLDDLGKHLGYHVLDDWYAITSRQIMQKGGTVLLQKHNNSYVKLLEQTYPEHKWVLHKFTNQPKKFWQIEENQKNLFDSIAKKIGIN